MRVQTNPWAAGILVAFMLASLTGCCCHHDCGCSGGSAAVVNAAPPPSTPPESAPKVAPAPVTPPAPAPVAAPKVAGKWVGTWESAGRKEHGGGLKCDATEAGPGKWAAVFIAEYGQIGTFKVNLEGKLVGNAVQFGGKVNLGPSGDYTWTGEATQTAFTGKYQGGGDTGTFQMVRAPN